MLTPQTSLSARRVPSCALGPGKAVLRAEKSCPDADGAAAPGGHQPNNRTDTSPHSRGTAPHSWLRDTWSPMGDGHWENASGWKPGFKDGFSPPGKSSPAHTFTVTTGVIFTVFKFFGFVRSRVTGACWKWWPPPRTALAKGASGGPEGPFRSSLGQSNCHSGLPCADGGGTVKSGQIPRGVSAPATACVSARLPGALGPKIDRHRFKGVGQPLLPWEANVPTSFRSFTQPGKGIQNRPGALRD